MSKTHQKPLLVRDSNRRGNPHDWPTFKLSDVARCQGGSAFSPSLQGRASGEIPFLKVSDMNLTENQWEIRVSNNYVTKRDASHINGGTKPKGSVIFPKVGAAIHTNKKRFLGNDAYVDNNVLAIWTLDEDLCTPAYLYLYFLTINLSNLSNPGPLPSINNSKVYELKISLPPKPEQQKIAAVLWKMQRAITTQDRLIAATRDLKQSTMQHLFTHGLRGEPLKDTAIGPMPESWRVCSLSGVAHLARGRFTHRPRNEPRFYGGETPFVQTGDIVRSQGLITKYSQSLNAEGVAISRVFPKGTILITIAANIGYVGVLDFDSACPDSLVGITPNKTMNTSFLVYYLQLQQSEMDRQAPKGTQKNINIQFLQPWPVVVPSLDEQRDIATTLATIDRKLAHHQKKRAALNDLFQTTLHQLMTAQIRVADLDIDTSDVADHVPDTGNMIACNELDHIVGADKMITAKSRRFRH